MLPEEEQASAGEASRSIRSTSSCRLSMAESSKLPFAPPDTPVPTRTDGLGGFEAGAAWTSTERTSGGIGTIGLAGRAFMGYGSVFTGTYSEEVGWFPAGDGGGGDLPSALAIAPVAPSGIFAGVPTDGALRRGP